MKIAITRQEVITAKKDGTVYIKLSGFNSKGKTVSAFLPASRSEIPPSLVPDKELLQEAFSMFPICNVEFDETGRIEEVTLDGEEEEEE